MPLFGTNGIRGIINETLEPELGFKFGMAVATYYENEDIAVAYDNRTTSEVFKNMVEAGILNAGKNVVDLGIVPAPAAQIYCKVSRIPGVIVTASHNPPEFNGLKVISYDGSNPGRNEEERIEEIITRESFYRTTWDFMGKTRRDDAIRPYVEAILKNVSPNKVRSRRFRVLVDCANSTTSLTTPLILNKMGVRYVSLNSNLDGMFPGRNSEPTPDSLTDMINTARSGEFDLSVAHDGDGDRAFFLDEKGNPIDGDKFVALIADHILESRKGNLVFPVASSFLIDRIAEKHGVKVIRTPVGTPVISDYLKKYDGIMGGEENGKVVLPQHLNSGDGGLSLALILDLLSNTEQRLSELISQMPDYKLRRLKIENRADFESIKGKLKTHFSYMKPDEIDGLRLVQGDSFILLRKSGTEPAIRIFISSLDDQWIKSREEEILGIISEKM
ncbi:MAG: phosphoglucosamine mutase [Thermoplasmatales archaeon]